MRLNLQQFYIDLQDELLDLFAEDEEYARKLKHTIDKVKKKQTRQVGWCDEDY